MELSVIDTNETLVKDVNMYLHDAGFTKDLYRIDDFNHSREYVEVFFLCDTAVDYINTDILNSEYCDLLEIKVYEYEIGLKSAIITYIY